MPPRSRWPGSRAHDEESVNRAATSRVSSLVSASPAAPHGRIGHFSADAGRPRQDARSGADGHARIASYSSLLALTVHGIPDAPLLTPRRAIDMNVTTGRLLIALAAVCVLALGGLEMLTERAGMDRAAVSPLRPGVVERDPVWDTIAPAESSNPALDAAQMAMAVQGGRMTVLDVDEKAGRLVSVSGNGRVLESGGDRSTGGVTEGQAGGAGRPAPGRGRHPVRAECRAGPNDRAAAACRAAIEEPGPVGGAPEAPGEGGLLLVSAHE